MIASTGHYSEPILLKLEANYFDDLNLLIAGSIIGFVEIFLSRQRIKLF